MVMRIDDRQLGLKDRLLSPIEPILAGNGLQGCRLLCVCGERPCRRRTTEESDELAPFH
jgi:hypothetical protein